MIGDLSELVVVAVPSLCSLWCIVTDDLFVSIADDTVIVAVSELLLSVETVVNCASEVFLFSQDDRVAGGVLEFSVSTVFINSINDCQSLSFTGAVLNSVTDEVT